MKVRWNPPGNGARLAAALAQVAEPEPKRIIKPPPPEARHNRLNVGQIVEIHRLAATGLSQRKIAKEVGTHQASVQRVLSGKAYGWVLPPVHVSTGTETVQ